MCSFTPITTQGRKTTLLLPHPHMHPSNYGPEESFCSCTVRLGLTLSVQCQMYMYMYLSSVLERVTV